MAYYNTSKPRNQYVSKLFFKVVKFRSTKLETFENKKKNLRFRGDLLVLTLTLNLQLIR